MSKAEELAAHIALEGEFLTPQNGEAWVERQRLLGVSDAEIIKDGPPELEAVIESMGEIPSGSGKK